MNADISPPTISMIVLACVLASAAIGLWARNVLPEQHLASETKEVVRLGTGLVATIAALVLSLLISSAQTSFDRTSDEMLQNAAKALVLDRLLAEYGAETKDVRALLKSSYARRIEMLFSTKQAKRDRVDGKRTVAREERVDAKLLHLVPAGAAQERLLSRALEINGEIELTSVLMHVQQEEGMPMPLLIVLVVWLSVIFATFGLFAPRNGMVVLSLSVCAASAAGAVFLILEMNTPFSGILNLSDRPMVETLARLGESP